MYKQQNGGSTVVTLLVVLVLAYGVYIAIQYVPQFIESKSVAAILTEVQEAHRTEAIRSVDAVNARVIRMLQINEMNEMTDKFSVKKMDGGIIITFAYDRELNLGYTIRPMHYEKSVRLN